MGTSEEELLLTIGIKLKSFDDDELCPAEIADTAFLFWRKGGEYV
jgi:hypothetical protein